MKREDSFALSPTEAKRVAVLFAAYGLLLAAAACYYYIVSGDRRSPLPYLFQVAVVGVCAWGINSRRGWALVVGGVFAAWYVYDGVSNLAVLLNAGGMNATMSIQVIIWLLALRTALLIVLLSLLLFYTGRGQSNNR
ncbi:MAG TPA: hypothetical protein VN256_15910 [Pyrinomonadaceae bacterium]|nr:hypothetical protein [Pyrinomonadaceae bacterium]